MAMLKKLFITASVLALPLLGGCSPDGLPGALRTSFADPSERNLELLNKEYSLVLPRYGSDILIPDFSSYIPECKKFLGYENLTSFGDSSKFDVGAARNCLRSAHVAAILRKSDNADDVKKHGIRNLAAIFFSDCKDRYTPGISSRDFTLPQAVSVYNCMHSLARQEAGEAYDLANLNIPQPVNP
ncbi:MAG TPA: hypothetical protein VIF12_00330 [Micavibrio sp.]